MDEPETTDEISETTGTAADGGTAMETGTDGGTAAETDGGTAAATDGGTAAATDGGTGDADDGKSLFDMDDGDDGTAEGEEPAEPAAAQVEEFLGKIKVLDLGAGVRWDDALLRKLAPEMVRQGMSAKQANAIVAIYAEEVKARNAAAAKTAHEFRTKQIAETKQEFGDGLQQTLQTARRGAVEVFGEEFAKELLACPELANDKRFIRAMAAVGTRLGSDGGVATGGPDRVTGSRESFAKEWARTSM